MTWSEPQIMYCSTCYNPALCIGSRTRLLKISHIAAGIIGLPTPMLSQMIDHAILKKARAVAAESITRSLHIFMFFRLEEDIVA